MDAVLAVTLPVHVVILGIFALDIYLLKRDMTITVKRDCPSLLPLNGSCNVRLELYNPGARKAELIIRDEPPLSLDYNGNEFVVTLQAGGRDFLEYKLEASQRGRHHFGSIIVKHRTMLGLAWIAAVHDTRRVMDVFPDFRGTGRYLAAARSRAVRAVGARPVHSAVRRGEFAYLRPYMEGDEPSRVDWKATARHGALIVREMAEEQSQRVLILLDIGRRMMSVPAGLGRKVTRLDVSLKASLALANVAEAYGDSVGGAAYSNEVEKLLAPCRPPGAAGRLARTFFDLNPRPVEPDLASCVGSMERMLERRSLVVILTQVRDAIEARNLGGAISMLSKKHVVLCTLIHDPSMAAAAGLFPRDMEGVYRKVAASRLLDYRREAVKAIASKCMVIDVDAERAPSVLVTTYLQIKSKGII
ncbi:MAG: DUF58 domain-containing protein [Deltaproteobacteria bacterium]|nr:DUF58 domain-containing protein [Deltaproteobacteria bacterium]